MKTTNQKSKMAKRIMSLLFIALCSHGLFSQQINFKNIIDFQLVDEAWNLKQTNDDGYVFTGFSTINNGKGALSIVKTNKNGTMQWQHTYNTLYFQDMGRWIEQTSEDGGYIIVADSTGLSKWDIKTLLMKTNAAGQVQWTRHYGDYNKPHHGNCIKNTFDGGYIVCGNYLDSLGYHQYMLKTDLKGFKQWYKTYYEDYLYKVIQTSDSGYVAFGKTRTIGAGSIDVMLLKMDKNGNQQWVKTYGTAGCDEAYSFDTIPGGGYICLCRFDTCGLLLLKTDANGNVLWVNKNKVKNAIDCIRTDQIHHCSDGGYFYAVRKRTPLIVPGDTCHTQSIVAVKTDALGDTLWTREFGFQQDSSVSLASSLQTNDGGYAILGTVQTNLSSGSRNSDYYLIKLDSVGNITTRLYSIGHLNQENVIVYPNPSDGLVNLEIKTTSNKSVNVEITNINGQVVYNKYFSNATQVEIDLTNQPKGMYFLKLMNEDVVRVEKIIIR